MFSFLSKKFFFAIAVETYAKVDINVFSFCSILLDCMTFTHIFCHRLSVKMIPCSELVPGSLKPQFLNIFNIFSTFRGVFQVFIGNSCGEVPN